MPGPIFQSTTRVRVIVIQDHQVDKTILRIITYKVNSSPNYSQPGIHGKRMHG